MEQPPRVAPDVGIRHSAPAAAGSRHDTGWTIQVGTEEIGMTGMWRSMAVCAVLIGSAAGVSAQDKAKIDQGAALFTSQKCSMCHSVAGKGNPKGALDGVGSKLSDADIRGWLTDPEGMRAKTNATRTPAMKKAPLNPGQVDALAAYMLSLKK